jgi:hypothetical protein
MMPIEVEELLRKGRDVFLPEEERKRREELVLEYLRQHDNCPQCKQEWIGKQVKKKKVMA